MKHILPTQNLNSTFWRNKLAHNIKVIMVLVAILVSFSQKVIAQTEWTKYEGNPVLDVGPSGTWDDQRVKNPSVIYDGTTYKMWYDSGSIGYATSTDGVNWTKHEGNPVLTPGLPDDWDSDGLADPWVVYDGATYQMWYAGFNEGVFRIGYATSVDGVTWGKYSGNPVLDLGDWDNFIVSSPRIILEGGIYEMWYTGVDSSWANTRIGYAVSSDGANWTKYDGNPILYPGSSGDWDDTYIHLPAVIKDGGTYKMWYNGRSGNVPVQYGYATSPDGINWERYSGNPVLLPGIPGNWDTDLDGLAVIYDGTTYKMWYTGVHGDQFAGYTASIGYATSLQVSIEQETLNDLPHGFSLHQNYPNPFNPVTTLRYDLGERSEVVITIYDILGRNVRTLVSGVEEPGFRSVIWDGTNDLSEQVGAGVYLYQIRAAGPSHSSPKGQAGRVFTQTRKMVLLK